MNIKMLSDDELQETYTKVLSELMKREKAEEEQRYEVSDACRESIVAIAQKLNSLHYPIPKVELNMDAHVSFEHIGVDKLGHIDYYVGAVDIPDYWSIAAKDKVIKEVVMSYSKRMVELIQMIQKAIEDHNLSGYDHFLDLLYDSGEMREEPPEYWHDLMGVDFDKISITV